jgi:anti-anti-sigma factor
LRLFREIATPARPKRSSVGRQASLRVLFAPLRPLVAAWRGARESSRAVPYAGHFQLTVEESGATSHLRLMGEFDRAAVGRVENALDRVFQAPTTRRVVFDLRRLRFLDAAGLRTILRANERARVGAFELVVARPRGMANRIFTLTRAGRELSMVDEPEVVA